MKLTNPTPFIKQVLRCLELPGVRRNATQLDIDERGQDHRRRILEPGPTSETESELWHLQRPPFVVDSSGCSSIGENQQVIITAQTVKLQRLDWEFIATSQLIHQNVNR
jgi:hypothetical protein